MTVQAAIRELVIASRRLGRSEASPVGPAIRNANEGIVAAAVDALLAALVAREIAILEMGPSDRRDLLRRVTFESAELTDGEFNTP